MAAYTGCLDVLHAAAQAGLVIRDTACRAAYVQMQVEDMVAALDSKRSLLKQRVEECQGVLAEEERQKHGCREEEGKEEGEQEEEGEEGRGAGGRAHARYPHGKSDGQSGGADGHSQTQKPGGGAGGEPGAMEADKGDGE